MSTPRSDLGGLPADPALPGIPWLERRGLATAPGDRPPTLCLIKHRLGKRMVVREHPAPSGREIYWKLYAHDRGARSAAIHRMLFAARDMPGLPFRVPEVVEYRAVERALGLAPLAGRPLTSLHGVELMNAATAAGRALAALHRLSRVPERTWRTADEWRVLERACNVLASCSPSLALRARALAEAIRVAFHATAWPQVFLHRDFHPGQVLHCDAGGTGILDWDDAASGAAPIDVGNFVAHLRLEALRHPEHAREWEAAEAGFLGAYAGAGESSAQSTLAVFISSTLLRLSAVALLRGWPPGHEARLLEAAEQAAHSP